MTKALVIEADQELAERRRRVADADRHVSIRSNGDGTAGGVFGRLDLLSAHQFDGMVDRIADILQQSGDVSVGFNKRRLRATAVGILAQPARALALLQSAVQPAVDDPPAIEDTLRDWLESVLPPVIKTWAIRTRAIRTRAIRIRPLPEEPPQEGPEPRTDPFDWSRTFNQALVKGIRWRRPIWEWADDAFDPQLHAAEPGSAPPPVSLTACAGHTCGAVTVPAHQLLPRAQLVVHLSYETAEAMRGVTRVEGFGPVDFEGLIAQLGGARVTIKPVIDLNQIQGVDRYEIPFGVRDAVLNRDLYEAFPGSQRRSNRCDLDHTQAWRGRRGRETSPGNLGPLGRRVHRAKTAGLWSIRQPRPGHFELSSPLGIDHEVTPSGSRRVLPARE